MPPPLISVDCPPHQVRTPLGRPVPTATACDGPASPCRGSLCSLSLPRSADGGGMPRRFHRTSAALDALFAFGPRRVSLVRCAAPPDRNGGAPLGLCRCGGQTRPVRRCVRRRPDQRDGAPAQIRSRGGGRVWSIQIRHVDAFVAARSSRSRGLRVSAHAGACAVECPCGADESRQSLTDGCVCIRCVPVRSRRRP